MRRVLAAALLALAGPASAQIFSETNAAWAPGVIPYFGAIDPSFLGAGSTQAMWLPLSSTGAVLAEDAGTVSHVTWDGVALRESVSGVSWSMNGTVPQVGATSGPFTSKAGAGPYSAANNYSGPTTVGEWAGDWSVTVVFNPSALGVAQYIVSKTNAGLTDGWVLQTAVSGAGNLYVHDGAYKLALCSGTAVAGGINVMTGGRSGGSVYCRLNGGAAGSVAIGTPTGSAGNPIRIGVSGGATVPANLTTIYEVLASTTPYSDALHAERWARVVGATTSSGTVTTTRADPLTYTANGSLWSAPAATPAISASGMEVWKGTTQLYPTPVAPAAGTATATVTGNHTFSVIGTGSQQISAGTATTTGLPCTATEASPCVFGVTVTGTLTLAAVTGSLTYGQVEAGAYRTPQVLTLAARAATVATAPLPELGNKWCVSITATPGDTWTNAVVGSGLWYAGTAGGANTMGVYRSSAANLGFVVYDAAAATKVLSYPLSSLPTPARITACNNSGHLSMCANGTAIGSPSGAGTGLGDSTPATLNIGNRAGLQFDGALRDLKVCKGATKCSECR